MNGKTGAKNRRNARQEKVIGFNSSFLNKLCSVKATKRKQ
jgi:hypothetical protein